MTKVNALQLRQSLGKVLRKLEKTGEPILVEKGREPKAVLISLEDYRKRFVDYASLDERARIVREILEIGKRAKPGGPDAVTLIRELRGPLP